MYRSTACCEHNERVVAAIFFVRVSLHSLVDARLRNHMLVCFLVCLFALQSDHSTKLLSKYCCDLECKLNTSPSVCNFDHVAEEFRIHHRSRAMTLCGSSADGCLVVMRVPTSFKTESVRSHCQFLQPFFCGCVWLRLRISTFFLQH